MNEEMLKLINDLKWEVDRLKHEVKLLTINSDSHERRFTIQSKTNDLLFEEIKKRQII